MANLCNGSFQPLRAGSCCVECGESFGWPHPANAVVGSKAPMHDDNRSSLYLKCEDCGEVFSDLRIAHNHEDECPDKDIDTTWTIVTEEEAY